jgi:hypothetical protein
MQVQSAHTTDQKLNLIAKAIYELAGAVEELKREVKNR